MPLRFWLSFFFTVHGLVAHAALLESFSLVSEKRKVTVATQTVASHTPNSPKHHFVDLHATRCFNKKFCETPHETAAQMVLHILTMLNPRGRGCCFKHIGLITLRQCINMLSENGCDTKLKPATAWQCSLCCAMHNNDEQDGVDRECWVCGHGHMSSDPSDPVQLSGDFSSSLAWELGDDMTADLEYS